jgi:hypothetical protein
MSAQTLSVAPYVCPGCGAVHDGIGFEPGETDLAPLRVGDFTICARCLAVLELTKPTGRDRYKKLGGLELKRLPLGELRALAKLRREVAGPGAGR